MLLPSALRRTTDAAVGRTEQKRTKRRQSTQENSFPDRLVGLEWEFQHGVSWSRVQIKSQVMHTPASCQAWTFTANILLSASFYM